MMLSLLTLALGLGAPEAHAQNSPFMWGVGPTMSTIVFPGQHPLNFPKLAAEDAARVPAGDLNDNDRIDGLDNVGGDANLGLRGLVYFDRTWRAAARFHMVDFASNYNNLDLTFEVDKMMINEGKLGAYAGAGLGFGTMRFGDAESDAELKVNTYNVRGHVGGIFRLKKAAIEAGAFAALPLPGRGVYTPSDGSDQAEIIGVLGTEQGGGGGNYWNLGLEFTVYYGDFIPPKKKNKKKKGKKNRG